jgi:thioredoxin reductase (NADPH)
MHDVDVVIIGAGPAGLFSVFECGMLGMRCAVFDALPHTGGQCTALYPQKPIFDIPGFPSILAQELIQRLEEQAAPFKPFYFLSEEVIKITKKDDKVSLWEIEGNKGTFVRSKAIIIAGGVGSFGPNRPPLDDIEQFEGKSVFYSIKDSSQFEGKDVVIAGGGDSAVDWAIVLSKKVKSLHIIHRRDKFRAHPESERQLKEIVKNQPNIKFVIPYQLSQLNGKDGVLSRILLSEIPTSKTLEPQTIELKADYLLAFFGLSMNLGPISEWGLSLHKSCVEVDPTTAQTSSPGIYAIGDMSTYVNKKKLILCGFAEATFAAYAIRDFLNPGQVFHFEYSTTSGVHGVSH